MQLKLNKAENNMYPLKGFVIWDASPTFWAAELHRMNLSPQRAICYALPGKTPNSVSGVLVIPHVMENAEFAYNQKVQSPYPQLYIPEFTELNLPLSEQELAHLEIPYFLHPIIGFVPLEHPIEWTNFMEKPPENRAEIQRPAKGVKIPKKIKSIRVEIEEKELENPFADAKVKDKELPFNLKNVMQGNQKEIDKFMRYLDKNPDAALKYAVPMDLLGTSRGKAIAKYKFGGGWFDFGNFGKGFLSSEKKNKRSYTKLFLALIIVGFVLLSIPLFRSCLDSPSTNNSVETNTVDNWTYQPLLIGILGCTLIIVVRLLYMKFQQAKRIKNPNWLNLSEDDALFDFKEPPKPMFSFGGEDVSLTRKIFLAIVLLCITLMVISPMLREFNLVSAMFLLVICVSLFKLIKS